MAICVIGGLIASTVLSLVMVPVFYEIFDDMEQWIKRRLSKLITPRTEPVPHVAPAKAAE
jgi:HAE1 family hydrophobic/amphiphilic exporter-1